MCSWHAPSHPVAINMILLQQRKLPSISSHINLALLGSNSSSKMCCQSVASAGQKHTRGTSARCWLGALMTSHDRPVTRTGQTSQAVNYVF